MRIVIQRVSHASVSIDGKIKSSIGQGMLILVGVEDTDTNADAEWLAKKTANLRIFDDENGVMNRSIQDIDGEALIISQFTLFASTKKGNRPAYIRASKPEHAIPMYESFCRYMQAETGKAPGTGVFGADMKVELLNDGPVTICIDSQRKE